MTTLNEPLFKLNQYPNLHGLVLLREADAPHEVCVPWV